MRICQTAVCTLQDQEGRQRSFRYTLTVEQCGTADERHEFYGISIIEEGGGRSSMPALTRSFHRASALRSRLVRNGVGPVGLHDVIEDWK